MSHAVRYSAGNVLHQIGCAPAFATFIAALLLPSHFPRLLTSLLSILSAAWPRGERGKTFRLAVGNLVLLRHDRRGTGWSALLRTGSRSAEELLFGAVCLSGAWPHAGGDCAVCPS